MLRFARMAFANWLHFLTAGVISLVVSALATAQSQTPFVTAKHTPAEGELIRAVMRDDKEAIRALITRGADVNENLGTDEAPLTPLLVAIGLDYEDAARILLAQSVGLDLQRTFNGWTALDLATHFEQESLSKRLAKQMAADSQEARASFNLDEAVWIANGVAAFSKTRDYGTALGLQFIVETYHAGSIDAERRTEILKEAMRLRDEFQKVEGNAAHTPMSIVRLASFAAEAIEDGAVSHRAANSILAHDAMRDNLSMWQLSSGSSEFESSADIQVRRFQEDVLRTAYSVALEDKPNAGWVIDQFTAKLLNSTPQDTASTIVKNNSSQFHPAVSQLIDAEARQLASAADSQRAFIEKTASEVLNRRGQTLVVTSRDRSNSAAHRRGAIDIRSKHLDPEQRRADAMAISEALGKDYTVVIEEVDEKSTLQTNTSYRSGKLVRPSYVTPRRADGTHTHIQPDKRAKPQKITGQDVGSTWSAVHQSTAAINKARIKGAGQVRTDTTSTRDSQGDIAILESSIYLLKTFAFFDNPKLSRQIEIVGGASIKIATSLHAFAFAGPATVASSLTLVGGLVSAGMMISALMDHGPTIDQVILKQVGKLREEVQEVRREMHERFNALDRRLDGIVALLVDSFSSVRGDIQSVRNDLLRVRQELRVLAVQVSLMESAVSDLEPDIRGYLEDGFDRQLWQQVLRCIEWSQHERVSQLPYEEYSKALSALRIAGTKEAMDSIGRGRDLKDDELRDDSKLASRFLALTKDGFDSNVAVLQSVSRRFAPKSAFARKKLANPLRWALMASAYAQLASEYPDYYYKRTTPAALDELLAIGTQWEDALKSLRSSDGKNDLYQQLVEYHEATGNRLRGVIRSRIESFQADHVDGYDLWGGGSQSPREGRRLKSFGQSRFGDQIKLDGALTPPEFESAMAAAAVVDKSLLIAHHLKLGELSIDLQRDSEDVRVVKKGFEQLVYGKPAVQIRVSFKPSGPESASVRIVERRLTLDKEEVHFATRSEFITNAREPAGWKAVREAAEKQWQLLFDTHWPLARRDFFAKSRDLLGDEGHNQAVACAKTTAEAVEKHLKAFQPRIEEKLRDGWLNGADAEVVDAVRQVTASKGMIRAFMMLGMPTLLTENSELRHLLGDATGEKGQTGLLNDGVIEGIVKEGTGVTELGRDAEWVDGPPRRFRTELRALFPKREHQPLIHSTMRRLSRLKAIHELVQPEQGLSEAAEELRMSIRSLDK